MAAGRSTDLLKCSDLINQKHPIESHFYSPQTTPVASAPSASPGKPFAALREWLGKHRSDMLCALGEAEEYESLCKELPEVNEEARSLYSEARERSALLPGKIKAIESLLSSNNSR